MFAWQFSSIVDRQRCNQILTLLSFEKQDLTVRLCSALADATSKPIDQEIAVGFNKKLLLLDCGG